jgi:hypothetical protein
MRILLSFLAIVAAGFASPPYVWLVDSLVKVFPDDVARPSQPGVVLVPRNGHGSVQVALRSDEAVPKAAVEVTLGGGLQVQVRRVGYVPVGSNPPDTPYDEVLRPAPALFPDPLFEESMFPLVAGRTEAAWITIYAPATTRPGEYTGEIKATGTAPLRFRVHVAEATVPERQTLKVTNWFNLDRGHLSRYFKIDSDESYWEVLGNIGRVMAEHRQNVILTPVADLTGFEVRDGSLAFDFTGLDRWVDTFEKAGLAGTIEGGHLLSRASGYHTALVVPAYVIENGSAVPRNLEPDDPRAEAFFNAFLPALYAHLKQKGWLSRYVQHIHDEPHDEENPIYERYGKIIRRNLPGVPTVDAVGLDQDIRFFAEVADIWVPVLGSFDHQLDKIRTHVSKGGQAWFYTCIFPQSRYLNRFIDYPLLKTRLLHWFNYRHDFTGFLHWGGNFWGPRPFENVQTVINDNRTLLPAGDNAIVYPDPQNRSVLSSIRLEQMREGIEDYELLAALARRDPKKATALAQAAIPNINDYVRDIAEFRSLHARLLGETVPKPPAEKPTPTSAAISPVKAWLVDALVKVFPGDAAGKNALDIPVIDAARRSHTSIQLALRSDRTLGNVAVDALPLAGPGLPIETATVRRVEYVVVTTNTRDTPEDELVARAPGLFPDALLPDTAGTLEKDKTRSVWVTVAVPARQEPGEYKGVLRVRQGAEELVRVPYILRVHAATVPEDPPLAISNHFTFNDSLIGMIYGCSRWTEEWWALIRNIARFLGSYHQNSIVADPVSMAIVRVEDGRLHYDFSNFERFVATFQEAGVDRYIEGGNLLTRRRERGAPIMMRAWLAEGERAELRTLPYADSQAQAFLRSFLPELSALLEKRGWTAKYLQGVLDEPHAGEYDAFAETAALVRKLLPRVRMIEPVGARQDLAFMDPVDIWIPQLGSFDEARLAELRKHADAGGELWFYTALTPRGRYPNRFIDYALLKTRLLHWMNFRYGFRGWLHWGGNYWGPEPFLDTQPVINDGRTYLPPGDAYIVYPDKLRRSVHSSIRLEQMREGIEDHALLEQLARRDPGAAERLAREAVASFTDYVREPRVFRALRRKLLEAL